MVHKPLLCDSYTAMARTKEEPKKNTPNKRFYGNAKKGKSKDAHKRNSLDGPPPPKKSKPNPPSLTTPTTLTTHPSLAPSASVHPATATQLNTTTTSEPLNPPSLHHLESTHDITSMHIISSSHIQQKVTRALEVLSVWPTPQNEKPKVVKLHAKAGVASKLVSIAEISKREVGKEGGKWFQYNKVEPVMVGQKQKVGKGKEEKGDGVGEKDDIGEESGEESTAFETMKTPWERANEGKPKMRAVPVITVFLSRVRIDGLRKAFG